MAHRYKKGDWNPTHPSRKGQLTARAKRAGVSTRAEASKDAHMKGSSEKAKKLRAQGVFAMNAQRGKFKHPSRHRSRARHRT
jgi:hypothetical protein